MKKYLIYIFGSLLFFGAVKLVFAYDLTLTKIGTLSTIGADYSLVSYTGVVPGLEGTATPAATVSIMVNSVSTAVLASTVSGVWNFTPTTLNAGDNLITVSSGLQSLVFIIRYNSAAVTATPTSTPAATVTTLPESGAWENIVYGTLFGITIWVVGRVIKKEMHKWEGGGKRH